MYFVTLACDFEFKGACPLHTLMTNFSFIKLTRIYSVLICYLTAAAAENKTIKPSTGVDV